MVKTCKWIGGALLFTVSACASSSIGRDVQHVNELANVDVLADVAEREVEPATSDDVRALLQEPLDENAALKIALLNNRELRASLRELGVARGALMQAGLLPNPTVEVELSPERNTQIELRAEYAITHALLAPLRAHAAQAVLEAERYRVAGLVIALGYRVRVGLVRLRTAQERVRVAAQVLEGFEASRDAAQAMFDAGNLRELDLVNEQAMLERARVVVSQLELDALVERERMQQLLGLYGTEGVWTLRQAPGGDQALPSFDDIERTAMRASVELAEIRARLDALARRAGLASAEGWIPDVALDLHALHGNPEHDAPAGTEPELRWGGGLSVGVPLFNRQQGTVTAIEAERDALLERYYGAAIEIRSAVRQARGRVQSAHARLLQYQAQIVPAQRRLTEQTLLQYNAMQVGVFQVLQAKREELDAQLALLDTQREYQSALAELEAIVAGQRVSAELRASTSAMSSNSPAGGH